MARTFLERLHNPKGRECGCSPECVCQRTAVGRALRWYIPKGFHKFGSADEKRARAIRPTGR